MSLFLFAGEPSGDLHGEALMKALRIHCPDLHLFGVGGPRMRAQGLETVMEMEKFQVMGFVDVAWAFPRLIRQFYQLRHTILERNPEIALFIDYPGFNLSMEKSLRKKGFRGQLCHYICPSVWAWGKKRIPRMEQTLDHLFAIFPFEKKLFSRLDVQFVGHPLIDRIQQPSLPLVLPQGGPLLSLFPGSRVKELDRNLSIQLATARRLKLENPSLQIAVACAQPAFRARIINEAQDLSPLIVDPPQHAALMQQSCLALAKSGTVTLELALHGVPTVVTYGLSRLDLFIARDLLRIRLPFYCIANIILDEELFPELIGPKLTEERLYEEASRLLNSDSLRQSCREKCRLLYTILTDRNPAEEIAKSLTHLYRQTQRGSSRVY